MYTDQKSNKEDSCNVDSKLWKCLTSLVSHNSRWIGSVAKEGEFWRLPPLSEAIVDPSDEESRMCVRISSTSSKGLCKFRNGCHYEGLFRNGRMEGEGVYRWTNGTKYEGEVKENKIEGKGRYRWTDGSWYTGDVKNGYRNGTGVLFLGDGKYYEGQWVNGRMYGHGRMVFISDAEGNPISYYEGEFVDSLRQGRGIRVYRTGNLYDGEWRDNLPHGQGRMEWRDQAEVYVGEWHQGVQSGYGEMFWETELLNSAQFPNKNHYTGEWKDGKRNGNGRLYYANGAEYWGGWVNDQKEGRGVYIHPNGDFIEGEFRDDKLLRKTERPDSRPLTPVSLLVGDVDEGESSGPRSEVFKKSLLHLISDKLDPSIELRAVHHALLSSIGELKWVYHFYSRIGTARSASPVFTRLKLWQLLTDCQLFYNETFSGVDQLLASPLPDKHTAELLHDPFVPFLLREFLQILVVLGYHLFGSLYGGESGRLAWGVKYLIEESLLPRACKGTGYQYQSPGLFLLSEPYQASCFKLYSCGDGKGTISYRKFLLMLRDCRVFELVPVDVVMQLMISSNPFILQEDCYRVMLQMNFLEFFNVLISCAKLIGLDRNDVLFNQVNAQDAINKGSLSNDKVDPLNLLDSDVVQPKQNEVEEEAYKSGSSFAQKSDSTDGEKNLRSREEPQNSSTDLIISQPRVEREDSPVSVASVEEQNAMETPRYEDTIQDVAIEYPHEIETTRWREQLNLFFDQKLFPEAVLALQPPTYLTFSL